MEGEYDGEELRIEVRAFSLHGSGKSEVAHFLTWFDTVIGGSGGTASSACHSG